MKKTFLLLVLTLAIFNLIAQDIMLIFHPVDPENKIDSIRAINAVTGTSFIEASNIINMSSFTTRIKLLPTSSEEIYVYPNPFDNHTKLQFYSGQTDIAKVSLTNIDGQVIVEKKQTVLTALIFR